MTGFRYNVLEAFEIGGRRYVASIRFSEAGGLQYWYAEILCLDRDEKYETGFSTCLEATTWVMNNRSDLERLERNANKKTQS